MARDQMGECNDKRQPEGEFAQIWCARCIRPDCVRSLDHKLGFNERTRTWEQRLFTDVARLPVIDPRHQGIAGQRFMTIDVGRVPEVRTAWVDPNEAPTTPDRPSAPEVQAPKAVDPAIDRRAPVAAPPPPPVGFQAGPGGQNLLRSNVPSQGGRVLQGAPATPSASDPWSAPAPPADPIVKPGARIRLGGVQEGAGGKKP